MRKEKALYYLLLRHAHELRARTSSKTYVQAVQSLDVHRNNGKYKITWQINGVDQEKIVDDDLFGFFIRGDENPQEEGFLSRLTCNNNARAKELACEILHLDIQVSNDSTGWIGGLPRIKGIIADVTFCSLLAIVGEMSAIQAAILCPLFILEYFHQGRLYTSLWFNVVAFSTTKGTAIVGALAYSLFQYLDPDRNLRLVRLGLSLLAFTLALGMVLMASPDDWHIDLVDLGILVAAIFLAAARSLFGSHLRAMPLTLPFLSAGMFLEGFLTCAALGFAYSVWQLFSAYIPQNFMKVIEDFSEEKKSRDKGGRFW